MNKQERMLHEQRLINAAASGMISQQELDNMRDHPLFKTYAFHGGFMERFRQHPAFEDAVFGAVEYAEKILSDIKK